MVLLFGIIFNLSVHRFNFLLQEQREERAVLYEKEKEFEIKDAEAKRERDLYRQRVRHLVRMK